jgi:hypothetical protein
VATNGSRTDRPSSGPLAGAGLVRGRLRAAAGALLVGGLIFFAGVSRPVVRDWAANFEDEAKRIAVAKADADEFTVGFVLMGVGFIVMGVALGLWGSAVTRLETGRRATAAIVLGLLAVFGGFGPGLVRIIGPFVDVEQAASESGALNVAFLIGALALTGCVRRVRNPDVARTGAEVDGGRPGRHGRGGGGDLPRVVHARRPGFRRGRRRALPARLGTTEPSCTPGSMTTAVRPRRDHERLKSSN